MKRISSDMATMDMQFYLNRKENAILNVQNKIGSNSRLNQLSDDPVAASHAVRYESFLARLDRFETNTKFAMEHFNNTHDYLNEVNSILQRIRELAVTGAHGTYSEDQHKIMAVEVNELLKELVAISNKTGPDTKQAFAGDKVFTEPFRVVEGRVDGGEESMIVRVEYRGAGATRRAEINDRTFVELDIGGDEAFWAERMKIFSSTDATDYRVQQAGAFFVDGVEIQVTPGDTLPAIVAKINDSSAPVKAYIDPDSRGLVLEGNTPHLIRAEDSVAGGATVLRDLGIINGNMQNNAPNWSNTAHVHGGSLFDMVIRLRDGMLRGDHEFIGSQGIAGIDLALSNNAVRMADVGSRQERAQMAWERINREIPDITNMLNRESGLDMADAAMELKELQLAHQATLQTAAKIIPPSLLDFLR
jgi:flagellar hook-associated protein 3 FlgL